RQQHPKYQGGFMTTNVSILATGLANLASVTAAFERLGTTTSIVTDPTAVKEADRLVVPGVGHFGAAMRKLTALGLVDPLITRVRGGRPTLGICLGLQIFGETSEESPEASGLGWIPSPVTSFPSSVISPQMGWNKVLPSPESKFLEEGYAYFANSYAYRNIPQGWSGATCQYGGVRVAAVEKDGFLGCQFHPELSGAYGERLLSRWLSQEVRPC
ncbi:MAG: imidazole glycerol phosphate synthase subunit HisH, partial [Myxococcota bacterium]|nr:imidazole glycerol phosphate synthase subunit HisH [Myxococcota bacterium]